MKKSLFIALCLCAAGFVGCSWDSVGVEIGGACTDNADCRSDLCVEKICVGKDKENGHSCIVDEECKSGYCDWEAYVCADRGNKPIESSCSNHADCASGYCDNAKHQCANKPAVTNTKENGVSCTSSRECKSNLCDTTTKKCVAAPTVDEKKQNGEKCSRSLECKSGYCDGKTFVCADKASNHGNIGNGGTCQKSEECASGYCDSSKKCAAKPSGGGSIADGGNCQKSEDCKSGYCNSSKKCAAKPSGGGSIADGENCQKSEDCKSGYCNSSKKCAAKPSGGGSIANGENCQKSEDCKSGYCNSSKKCATKPSSSGNLKEGAQCKYNDDCASGYCKAGKCTGDCELTGCDSYERVCRDGRCIPRNIQGSECYLTNYSSTCKDGKFCCNGFCVSNRCEPGIKCTYSGMCNSDCIYSDYSTPGTGTCTCRTTAECGNGYYCARSTTAINNDLCMELQQINAKCNSNEECKSGACEYTVNYDSAGRPSLNTSGGKVCVVPRDTGDICYNDDACKGTLSCLYSKKVEYKVCGEKYKKGEWCHTGRDCASGGCANSKCR